MANVTIRDVARDADVSIATVSYVLNNSRPVGEDTRQRVLKSALKLGYRANSMARNLQARETRLFGYTWQPSPPDQFNPILDSFLHAIAEAAARHNYHVLTLPTRTISDELTIYAEMMLAGQVDGFLLSNTNVGDARVRVLLEAGFPFVAFGRAGADTAFSWVDVDGTTGVRMATEHLIERGHTRIACLAWPEPSLTGRYRLAGYLEAMAAHVISVSPDWVSRGENTYADAHVATARLLALPQETRPSAIVALTDLMAIGAINAVWEAGLEAGRDVAIVGFDDATVARFLRPTLSSVRQPIAEVGERLVAMLVKLCQGKSIEPQQLLLTPELIVRESSMHEHRE